MTKPNEPEALGPFRSASQCTQSELALGQLLADIELTLKHARTFITSREKMHPDGVRLYDEDIAKVTAALNAYARAPAQPVADAGGVTDADRELHMWLTGYPLDDGDSETVRRVVAHRLQSVAAATAAKDAEIDNIRATLLDPVAVHMNMLRGSIARPSARSIIHVYGEDAIRAALSEAREAG